MKLSKLPYFHTSILPYLRTCILTLLLLTSLATAACTGAPAPTATSVATALPTETPPPPSTVTTTSVPTATATSSSPAPDDSVPVYTYTVVATYPHDPDAFTQGLVYEDEGILYEGTGLHGQSSVRKVELETGEVLQIHRLDEQYFGEGIAIVDDRIFQLTWQSNVGFLYDKQSFERLDTFDYTTEGWGLTYDGTHLIMSDGTPTLYFRDPTTFEEVRQVDVRDETGPVRNLNELEFVNGEVYANVWKTDRIARISPETGRVTAWIDLTRILPPEDRQQRVDVLNGIAYDADDDRLFVTGKWWPTLFEIELVPQ